MGETELVFCWCGALKLEGAARQDVLPAEGCPAGWSDWSRCSECDCPATRPLVRAVSSVAWSVPLGERARPVFLPINAKANGGLAPETCEREMCRAGERV